VNEVYDDPTLTGVSGSEVLSISDTSASSIPLLTSSSSSSEAGGLNSSPINPDKKTDLVYHFISR